MKYEALIKSKLEAAFAPSHLEILNESPQHGLPPQAEKHFRVVVVSPHFLALSRVDRHRLVHEILAIELKSHIHALSVQAYTTAEWGSKAGKTTASPECLGGGKREGLKG